MEPTKVKRYWLRGLVIGIIVEIGIIFIPVIVLPHPNPITGYSASWMIVFLNIFRGLESIGMPLGNLFVNVIPGCNAQGSWCPILPGLIGYFFTYPILGSIIGWAYGKIKNS